jgi:hypothetical protein
MQGISAQSKNTLVHGKGKTWLDDARLFIGEFYCDRMSEGKLYELQHDNRYSLF